MLHKHFIWSPHDDMVNPIKIARRLTQTRSASEIYHQQTNSKRRNQSDSVMFFRSKSNHDLAEEHNRKISETIKQWLSNSQTELAKDDSESEKRTSSSSSTSGYAFPSILESENETDHNENSRKSSFISSEFPVKLLKAAMESGHTVEDVTWDLKSCDLLVEVNNHLFPVEKNFITYVSKYFEKLLEGNEKAVIVHLDGYEENEIRMVLQYIYSIDTLDVTDENAACLLQLGEAFGVARLRFQCENYLKGSTTFNPIIALHLAKQYDLHSLHDYSLKEISKMENIENSIEFQALDMKTQNTIFRYMLQRYQKASSTLSQFDVHLCHHHGKDPKNNSCCFRAATYCTENDRTFLVNMEQPAKKLIHVYEDAYNINSENLETEST